MKKEIKKDDSNNKKILIPVLVIALVLGIVCILFFYGGNKNNTKPIKSIKSFHFSTVGIGLTSYDFTCDDYCYDSDGNELSDETVDKIIIILNEHRVREWNGFNKNNAKGMYDASGFDFEVELDDGTTIKASGSMAYPDSYGNFEEEIRGTLGKSY